MNAYQEIGHLFFPIYLGGCIVAVVLGASQRNTFWTPLWYGFLPIFMFQMKLDGEAPHYGLWWYAIVSCTQGFVMLLALVTETKASRVLIATAAAAITLNAAFSLASFLHHPLPRQAFFVGMNLMQSLQVGSLVFLAPFWPWAGRKLGGLIKRSQPWKKRQYPPSRVAVISGTR